MGGSSEQSGPCSLSISYGTTFASHPEERDLRVLRTHGEDPGPPLQEGSIIIYAVLIRLLNLSS